MKPGERVLIRCLASAMTLGAAMAAQAASVTVVAHNVAELLAAARLANVAGAVVNVTLQARHYALADMAETLDDACDGLPTVRGTLNIYGPGADKTFVESAGTAIGCPAGEGLRIFHVSAGGTLKLSGLAVRGGAITGNGAGIYNRGRLTLDRAMVYQNIAGSGGGVWNATTGVLTLTASSVANNVSNAAGGSGGGIVNEGSMSAVNSTIAGNRAQGAGGDCGGVDFRGAGPSLTNVTLANNAADHGGGALCSRGGARPTYRNTLIAANTPQNCLGIGNSGGGNLDSDDSCFDTALPSDVIPVPGSTLDARIGPLTFNGGTVVTVALMPGSPAVDRLATETCPATDERGVSRLVQGTGCDIGAFELVSLTLMPIGDSLTLGYGALPGWRADLRELLGQVGFGVNYVGNNTSDPTLAHDSATGRRLQDMSNPKPWLSLQPDVTLIMGGTNNFLQNDYCVTRLGQDSYDVAHKLAQDGWVNTSLMAELAANTNTLFVASIPPISALLAVNSGFLSSSVFSCPRFTDLDANADSFISKASEAAAAPGLPGVFDAADTSPADGLLSRSEYNFAVSLLLKREIDAFNFLTRDLTDGFNNVLFADVGAALGFADLVGGTRPPDGVHPLAAGYASMASAWFDAIFPILGAEYSGDFNHDGIVDNLDVYFMLKRSGQTARKGDPMDLDGDGKITVVDLRRQVLRCTLPNCASH